MTNQPSRESFDVVIVGSGAAGLTAAISASAAGASVCLLERSDKFGGTTAVSGGLAWVPNNSLMDEVGSSDTREKALTYLESLSLGRTERHMLEAFVDSGRVALDFLIEETPLHWHALRFPDYHPEFPGGTFGRSVMPDVFDARTLGDHRPKLRSSPYFPVPISLLDMERAETGGAVGDMEAIMPSEKLMERMQNDMVAGGMAMIAGLLKAAIDKGVDLRVGARVRKLIINDGIVGGVSVEMADGETVEIEARRGVILASGGYEHNADLVKEFIRGPIQAPMGVPSNEGDGLIMAMEAGAALGNMSEAWWQPAAAIPDEEYENKPFFRLVVGERTTPGAIIVNRLGKRFVNEAHNYNDITRTFHTFDPVSFDYSNLPAWLVFDHAHLEGTSILTRFPGDPVPKWLIQAPTLGELAQKIEVDAKGLEATVSRFNEWAKQGKDPDFHRGESAYDSFHGDQSREGAFKTLGPLETGPFYAMRLYSGTLGTKGGPKTNEQAEVLSASGNVIRGLYAAGNVMAGVTGMAYPGAGGTLGPAITFGYLAGRAAAGSNE